MKNVRNKLLLLLIVFIGFNACKKVNDDSSSSNDIVFKNVNQEFVLIRDVETLQCSEDPVSNHVDSILNGYINAEFISSGYQNFILNSDSSFDIAFEIINLHEFNPNGLPESFDSLAARVVPIAVQILDNSTYGYPDALIHEAEISSNGYWSNRTSVLGTFLNAGQFQGNGDRYLGFRFESGSDYKYGWIKLNCSQHNDTLKVISFAYNNSVSSKILAGQKQ
ncbi:MAG: hypothetical protein JXR60_02695 [Bacteroidales bacterium]|nr:hypothetical protein [Bacteroidales bacterium]